MRKIRAEFKDTMGCFGEIELQKYVKLKTFLFIISSLEGFELKANSFVQ